MQKINYPQLKETLYRETLDNGLTVMLLPKKDFHKTYALFTTNYGSIDNEFIPLGKKERQVVPDGIAHFLEHKMFEKKDGDVFNLFSKHGASANAFTSFTRTSYLFSATSNVEENLLTLLDFVQEPYFTKETVEKEKGIIGQEIKMYQDDTSWQLFFGILGNLYPHHPLSTDIAGTVESIAKITAEDLYTCYETFYHPSNMNLLVVGNIDVEDTIDLIRKNQANKAFEPAATIERFIPDSTSREIIPEASIFMEVNRPKVVVGIKGIEALPQADFEKMRLKITLNLLLQLLLGNTSKHYLEMYDEGLIDDSFGFEVSMDRDFYFADISVETTNTALFVKRIEEILSQALNDEALNDENLDLLKRKMLGKFLQSLNSLEFIANQFSQNAYAEANLFDTVKAIESVELQDIKEAASHFFKAESFSRFYVYPKQDEEKK